MDSGPPEFRALNNDLVLESIFKNLSTSTLLSFRLTNKKWNKIASDILKRRPLYLSLPWWGKEDLQEPAELLSNNDFPATGLKIIDPNMIHTLDESYYAKKFFSDFGSRFTHVYLEECKFDDRLVKLLTNILPRIEVLSLKHVKSGGQGSVSSKKKLLLPCLREIQFEEDHYVDKGLVVQLLSGSPNLKTLHGVPMTILSELLSQKRLGMLASLVLEQIRDGSQSGIYKSLTQQPPALTEFTLGVIVDAHFTMQGKEFQDCARAILISSQNTLKKLRMGLSEMQAVGWQDIPGVFLNLHTIALMWWDNWDWDYQYYHRVTASPCFHNPGSANKFPVLKKVCLVPPVTEHDTPLALGTAEMLQRCVCASGLVLKSVDTLELHNYSTPDGIKYLTQAFPNVSEVIFNFSHAGFNTMAEAYLCRKAADVWYVRKFQSLRKLVIVDFPTERINLHLDSFLTGIPLDICKSKSLQKAPRKTFDAPMERILRPYGGLWKLRKIGLRELVISCSRRRPQVGYPVMSQAAVWYGLDVIPDLKTTYRVPRKAKPEVADALMPLLPRVSVEYY